MQHISTRGFRAFKAHRWSGLLILGYLYLHLVLLSAILMPGGAAHFNTVAHVVEQPLFVVADLVLFALILIHALNGIRLILADLGWFIQRQRAALWGVILLGAVLLLLGSLAVSPAITH